jgi:peptidoglycan hydrolase-like protein with peptidoglycan-binding domain
VANRCVKLLVPGPYMEKGSKGPAVAVLQIILITSGWGFDYGVVIDGDFGERTEQALMGFQRSTGLEADGKCGPMTRAKLSEITGVDINALSAAVFTGKTVLVPPTPWPKKT